MMSAADHMLVPSAEDLPPALLERLRIFAAAAGKGGLAPKTVKALASDGRLFRGWCVEQGHPWLPAEPATVAGFVEAMAALGRAPATIQRYLFTVSTLHAAAELPDPTGTLLVRMARQAHARKVGTRQKQARPLGAGDIERICRVLDEQAEAADALEDELASLRDVALLLVARDSLARADELVALRRFDLEVSADGSGTILIRRGKTDQEGRGRVAWLSPEAVKAAICWLMVHDMALDRRRRLAAGRARQAEERQAELQSIESGPGVWRRRRGRPRRLARVERVPRIEDWVETPYLFRSLPRAGWPTAMSTEAVRLVVRRRVLDGGILAPGYSGHSMRVGSAQDLLADGADLLQVMQAGGWRSPEMAARYGERILANRGGMAAMHARRKAKRKDEEGVG
jgi:site-specific recombinase XerD